MSEQKDDSPRMPGAGLWTVVSLSATPKPWEPGDLNRSTLITLIARRPDGRCVCMRRTAMVTSLEKRLDPISLRWVHDRAVKSERLSLVNDLLYVVQTNPSGAGMETT